MHLKWSGGDERIKKRRIGEENRGEEMVGRRGEKKRREVSKRRGGEERKEGEKRHEKRAKEKRVEGRNAKKKTQALMDPIKRKLHEETLLELQILSSPLPPTSLPFSLLLPSLRLSPPSVSLSFSSSSCHPSYSPPLTILPLPPIFPLFPSPPSLSLKQAVDVKRRKNFTKNNHMFLNTVDSILNTNPM